MDTHKLLHLLALALEFFASKILLKFIVGHYMSWLFARVSEPWLERHQRLSAIWLHHQERARRKGHEPKSPEICETGKCALLG